MVLDRYARFADSADVLSCPLCHSALKLQEGSLVCPKSTASISQSRGT